MPPASSENELSYDDVIRRVKNGDQRSFEVIVRRLERPLRAWLATHASPAVDVDEVAQRSFVIAFNKLDAFEIGTDFAGWLFTIARYQLKAELTRLRRVADYHARFAPELLERELERRCDEPGDVDQLKLDHLKKCVASLGENLRQYITWRYDEGIRLEEMSARTGRSVGAIKKQLWQIRRKLQQCVEDRMKGEAV
ncbi:MAG: RNA polymerase factor sigma-70 [Verrucomicrobiales bacterium]|nr:RNA polymerase factor sigma-70 [Verrucomicrobiales bacterium]